MTKLKDALRVWLGIDQAEKRLDDRINIVSDETIDLRARIVGLEIKQQKVSELSLRVNGLETLAEANSSSMARSFIDVEDRLRTLEQWQDRNAERMAQAVSAAVEATKAHANRKPKGK